MSLAIGPASFPPGVQFASNGAAAGSLGSAPIAIRTADGQLGVFNPVADPARFVAGRSISVMSMPGTHGGTTAGAGSGPEIVGRQPLPAADSQAGATAGQRSDADQPRAVTVTPRTGTPLWMSSAVGYFANTSRAVLPLSGAFTDPTNVERARDSFNRVSRDVLPTAGAFSGSRNNLLNAVGYFDAATRGLTG